MSNENQSTQEAINWNSLEDPRSPTHKIDLGWFFIRLSGVLLLAIVLYLFGGLGGTMAALVAGWFVLYKN